MSKRLKPMSDAELSRRKKIQAKTSIAGSTLGLTALGLKGVQVAAKANPRTARFSKPISEAATTSAIGGAGIGGVGGYNFAAYTREDARRDKLRKGFTKSEKKQLNKERAQQALGAAAGAAAGQGVYQGTGYGTKHVSLKMHRGAVSRAKRDKLLKPAKKEYGAYTAKMERNYPKSLPEWKVHRALGYTHRGKAGMALGAASTAGGAYLGAMALRPEKKVSKAMEGTSAFGVIHKSDGTEMQFRLKKIPKKERQRTKAKQIASGAAVGGAGSAGLTAAMNGGKVGAGKAALAAGAAGAGLGAAFGAAAKNPKYKVALDKVKKAYDPEENRHRKTGTAIGAAGAGSALAGYAATKQGQKAKGALKASRDSELKGLKALNRISGTDKGRAEIAGAKKMAKESLGAATKFRVTAVKSGRNAAALGAGAAALGAGAVALDGRARKRGRTYRAWYDG